MSIYSESGHCMLTSIGCFIYDFQTLIIGVVAIGVAVFAGIPVWRQLKDTNLQTRISHRETLASLLRNALQRYDKVAAAIDEPLSLARCVTHNPLGEAVEITAEDAHHLDNTLQGLLDWYLIVLKDTEHSDIETCKAKLKIALDEAIETLWTAHWADHNDQHDEDHSISDDEWARIIADCAQAKIDASARVNEINAAYRSLQEAQQKWGQSLRAQIAKLDLQIAAPG